MPQRLILPINKCKITASYKTAAYKNRFGFTHYGIDMISFAGKTTVYASGDGEVIKTGLDKLLGNVVIVRYDDAYNRETKTTQSVIARYYHLASISAVQGNRVTKDTVLGQYGNTGKYSAGAHLHIEFDSNVNSPTSSKTLGGNSNIILASGSDTTINPSELLHIKSSAPDNQEVEVSDSTHKGLPYAISDLKELPLEYS